MVLGIGSGDHEATSSYDRFWAVELSVRAGSSGLSQDLREWVNGGLMTVFFFVVGLEARREFDMGELRDRRRLALPLAAGLGGWDLVVMYGQTEATARMAYLPPHLAASRPEAVGVPSPGGSFRLEPLPDRPPGTGALVYAGPNVMLGYAETPADLALGRTVGELRTGDVARRLPDGLYEVVGRRSRFLKVYGLRETVVLVGLALLVWVPALPSTALLNRPAAMLAGASLYIYLVHWQIYPLLDDHSRLLALPASLAGGVGYTALVAKLTRRGHGGPGTRRAMRAMSSLPVVGRPARMPSQNTGSGSATSRDA